MVAAGAVIARRGGREVLLVHRPKYDDWSFPKGKQDPGEHVTATAVREVEEETGLRVHLGRPLPAQHYEVRADRSKVVHYWVARRADDAKRTVFTPNDEVDEIRWLSLAEAARRLSYLDDCEILDAYRADPRRTHALVVVRHASATKRSTWSKPDNQRPLVGAGRTQAQALSPLLAAFGVSQVHTSPSMRCQQTVLPYAKSQGLPLVTHPGISEEEASPRDIATLIHELLDSRANTVLCSHRPVLPEIFDALGCPQEPLALGELVVFHHRSGRIHGVERHIPA